MAILRKVVMVLLIASQARAGADRPMIASNLVSDVDFRRYVETHDKKTLSEYFDMNRPGADNEARLREKLESAQRAWLGGSIDRARDEFRSLVDLAKSADWRDSQREVFLYAHLRLAQSSDTPIERNEWLERAARFASDLEPDQSLFPPPLVREYADVRSTVIARAVSVSLKSVFPGYRFVYVDGRKFELDGNPSAKVTSGSHRVTAVGDRQAPVTDDMSASRLSVFRVKGQVLVEGCGALTQTLDSSLVVDVLNSPDCQPSIGSTTLVPGNDWAKAPSDVSNRAKRDWLWIGAIAIGGAVAFSIARNQNKSEPSRVHREGF